MWDGAPEPALAWPPRPLPWALPKALLSMHRLVVVTPGEGPERRRGTRLSVPEKGDQGEGTGASRQGLSQPGSESCAWDFRQRPTGSRTCCAQRNHIPRMDLRPWLLGLRH